MWCPRCKEKETKVTDSRVAKELACIRRRRSCLACQYRFTTREYIEVTYPRVVKKDGGRRQFSEMKLRSGVSRALEKRPLASERFEQLIAKILGHILQKSEVEITSHDIGLIILDALKATDQVAYVRFASVYQSFDNIESFQSLIDDMQERKTISEETVDE